jgi:tetratricopeptide (TPR) repeat protein
MIGWIVLAIFGASLLPAALGLATSLSMTHGAWRLSRALGRATRHLVGSSYGGALAFQGDALALRENGDLAGAVALAKARVAEKGIPAWSRNLAIDILISAGEYGAALDAEPPLCMPSDAHEALGLALIQINLAEADYNLGRWEAAEARLRPLDLACWPFPITRAGLLQQRAWIAVHRGRAAEALELCDAVKPRWLPSIYRAEYHFGRAAALLALGCIDDAEIAVGHAEVVARRLSSKRNALFLRGHLAGARGDWVTAELHCRAAANHVFRGQGGDGLLLWAHALNQLGRSLEAGDALRLVAERDPESAAARTAAAEIKAA